MRKTKECPHCGIYFVPTVFERHVERCKIFTPLDVFVEYWNKSPRTVVMALRYKTDTRTVRRHITYLRTVGVELAPTQQEYNDPSQGKAHDSICAICSVVNRGDPCVFCVQEAQGLAFWQRVPERVRLRFEG